MKPNSKQLLSLLLVFVLVLGLMPSVFAATDVGTQLTTEPTLADDTMTEDELRWAELAAELPDPIKGVDPLDPDNPYPYGIPVDNFYPGWLLESDPYAVNPMADMSKIPEEMYDNAIIRALAYTGYDVQWLKNKGYLFVSDYIASSLKKNAPSVLSDIGYWSSGACPNGDETVTKSGTATGKAPNISYFEKNGLVCASFVTYYLCNYLPNIEGVDTSVIYNKVKEAGADDRYDDVYYLTSVTVWKSALDSLASKTGSGVTKYTNATTAYANLVPGDVIVFSQDGSLTHIAIYAGTYNMYNASGSNYGKYHFIVHVGNSRGPEISTVEYMADSGSKASVPTAWYHLDVNDAVDQTGFIEIYKKDPKGNNLSGAKFKAVDQASGDTYYIGPTDANGYARSGELPLGTYVVTETVFPTGYQASGTTSWTVTLTKDTPNNTITINAVNKKITGSLVIQKATNTGQNLGGWVFGVYTDSACTKPISGSPFTTPASGKITVSDLEPGTYYVKETSSGIDYWVTDNGVKTVKVDAGSTTTVTVTNNHYGYAKIIKMTSTGGNVSGWKFNIYSDKACTKLISGSPFITDYTGEITARLAPGTYYIQEIDESYENPMWEYDTTVREVAVRAGETASVVFVNNYCGYGQIIKTTNSGGKLEGWKFEVFRDQACTRPIPGSPFTTDAQGKINIKLLPGNYWVREVDESDTLPDWVFDTTVQKLTVKEGKTTSVTFHNVQYGYGLIIKSTNTGGDLEGWKFEIFTDQACTKPISGSPFITDAQGLIKTKLLPGSYWIREVDESDHHPDWTYDSAVRKVTVTAGTTRAVIFTNTHYGYAEIRKFTNTGKDLGGWKFDIFTDAALTRRVTGSPFTTDETGKMSVRLLPGTYYVREVDESAVKPDWVFDSRVHQVTVKAGETAHVTLKNQQMGNVKVIKAMPDGGPASGWVFDVYRKIDEVHMGTFTSGEDGTILSGWLLPGEYLVYEQLDEKSIYWCESENPQTVLIQPGQTAEVSFTNRLKSGKIAIEKVDTTGKHLAGAEFLLEWSADGRSWKPVVYSDSPYVREGTCSSKNLRGGKLVSGETGLVEFTGLHPERLYRLTETAAPEGYQILTGTAYEGGLPVDGDLVVELTVVNVHTFRLPDTGSNAMAQMPFVMIAVYGLCAALVEASKRKAI